MIKNALKMSTWFLAFLSLSLVVITESRFYLVISKESPDGKDELLTSSIEETAGRFFSLTCEIGGPGVFSTPDLIWGRRTKELRFKNEADLEKLALNNSEVLDDLNNNSFKFQTLAWKHFYPLHLSDRGAHFCMSLKYNLFRIIHIKVKKEEEDPFANMDLYMEKMTQTDHLPCGKDKFRCVSSGYCINLHYKCDGKSDCRDDSDENWDVCNGDPCEGKIRCNDGRCIPTSWCCDKHTDETCMVSVRPSCCPPLLDPYDPVLWYHSNNDNQDVREMHKSNRSKYLFITICVISAILSFVLFLFVISKMCGFDTKPSHSRNLNSLRNHENESIDLQRCGHAECAIRREFSANVRCLYRGGANVISADNNNEVVDPLIIMSSLRTSSPSEISDQPPAYAEVVNNPPIIDKAGLDDLINAPPPPYSSTNISIENGNGNNISTSDTTAADNYISNQNTHCDISTIGDSNINV